MGGLSAGDLEEALAEAVHSHLLVVSDDGRYRFRHALLQEAVLTDLLPGERVRLHAAIAAYLAATPAVRSGGRACASRPREQRPARGVQRLPRAAGACRLGAPAEELLHLESALALWPAVLEAVERAGRDQPALLLETAAAARSGGGAALRVALLGSALDLLADADPAARARAHYRSPRRWCGSRT